MVWPSRHAVHDFTRVAAGHEGVPTMIQFDGWMPKHQEASWVMRTLTPSWAPHYFDPSLRIWRDDWDQYGFTNEDEDALSVALRRLMKAARPTLSSFVREVVLKVVGGLLALLVGLSAFFTLLYREQHRQWPTWDQFVEIVDGLIVVGLGGALLLMVQIWRYTNNASQKRLLATANPVFLARECFSQAELFSREELKQFDQIVLKYMLQMDREIRAGEIQARARMGELPPPPSFPPEPA